MGLAERTKQALLKAIERAGNMFRLAEKSKVPYSVINRFYNGRNDFKNMTLGTFERLFPEISLIFFKNEIPHTELPPPENLDAIEKKIISIVREMNEEGRLEAIDSLSVLREKHSGKPE